jgi:two-component system nitrogen regulation sensor histidine kinase NtrY
VTLRGRIVFYLVVLHVLMAAVALFLLRENRLWFLAVEVILVVSVFVASRLLRAFFVPLELIRTGAELMQERDFTSRFQPVGQPEMDQLIAVYNRMVDQLRSERLRTREQNELFDRLVEAAPAGVVISGLDGQITDLNPAAVLFLEAEGPHLVGHQIDELTTPLGQALATLPAGESQVVAFGDGRRVRCRRAEFRDHGFARSFFLIEELTDELRRSEKAAYGKLIRLMSHEVMNSVASVSSLLTSVRGFGTALAKEDREDFDRALGVAVERMQNLGGFMNGFADVVRLPAPELHECDLEELLSDIATLVEPGLTERRIRLVRERGKPLPRLQVDKNQLEQVLLNLIKNAAEAIDEDGRVTLRSGRDGWHGWLEVEDTGPGIAPEAREELFTPFFTTKADGCGLGLMVVKEVLSGHGFAFSLENTAAGGARFRIVF